MNTFFSSLWNHIPEAQQTAILLSATCRGNDPTLSPCPLFHGSLAPMLFSGIVSESFGWGHSFASSTNIKLHYLLLTSHNITWAKHVFFPKDETHCEKVCETLANTRYSSRSVKRVTVSGYSISISVPFVKNHCQAVEQCDLTDQSQLDDQTLQLLSTLGGCIKKLLLFFNDKVTNDGLQCLLKLTALQHISLSNNSQTDETSLLLLSKIPSLKRIDLAGCSKVSNEGLRHLSSSLHHLEWIDLFRCQLVTDEGLQHLSKISSLKHVELGFCTAVTDEGILHLSELPLLEHLVVSAITALTEKSLEYLSKCSSLKVLDMLYVLRIPASKKEEFRKEHPGLELI